MLRRIKDAVDTVDAMGIKSEYKAVVLQVILQRILEAPIRPTVHKTVKPEPKTESKLALPDRIGELISDGFFKEPKGAAEVKMELKNRGYYHGHAAIGMALLGLVRKRVLRRIFESTGGKKQKQYLYTNL